MMEPPLPNLAVSLRATHAVITRGLGVAKERADGFGAAGLPDDRVAQGFADYVTVLATVLNAHHLTEDELAFPHFRDLIPGMPFERLSAEHRQMLPLLERLKSSADRMRESAGREAAAGPLGDIHGAAFDLITIWGPHIEVEESYWTPETARRLMSPEENARLIGLFAEHTMTNSKPDFLVVPFMIFNLPPEQRNVFTAGMPEVVTEQLVPVAWKEQWSPMTPFLLEV